jgi:radical SAM protein with 4Fe4S-binding SPASM domain
MKNDLPEHERALSILKTKGPKSVKNLAEELKITAEGARFHLMKLEKDGLVESESVVSGRGRPKQIWSLTEKGHNRFPDTHAQLTANLINMMEEALGKDAVNQVIDKHQQTMQERYLKKIEGINSLEGRIAKLADIRTNEGYMAEYEKEDDHYLFVENHCPICSAAKVCQGFCRAEIDTFQSVLGDEVKIERTEHIVAGERRCAYKVSIPEA